MTDMCVIVPTRGRPQNAERLIRDWVATMATATLLFAVDDDDPEKDGYLEIFDLYPQPHVKYIVGPRLRLGPTLNQEAVKAAEQFAIVAFMGDDHSPKTAQWDRLIEGHLSSLGTGVAYGDDLIQGATMPTAVFMTSDIIRTLGYMVIPGLIHLWFEAEWLAWGNGTNLRYCPEVVIQHLHPIGGVVEYDAGYIECNSPEVWGHDEALWKKYETEKLPTDLDKLRKLL